MNCLTCEIELAEQATCPNCEPNEQAVGAESIPTVQLALDGIQRSERATGFYCPDCDNSPLHVGTIGATQVCHCELCHGFVIDRASLGDLVELLRTAYNGPDDPPQPMDAAETQRQTSCPACFETMETFVYYGPGNVVIDTCEACKLTWLDSGELSRIVRAPGRRDYGNHTGESEVLRARLYAQASEDGVVGVALLGSIFF